MRTIPIVCLFAVMLAVPRGTFAFNQNFILSDADLTNVQSMYTDAVQRFLAAKPGTLGTYRATDIDGRTKSAAEIISRAAQQYILNPRMILVMLQKEQSLVTDPNPASSQYDWATGYGVCDGCSTADNGTARFRGFAKQIDSMAQQFRLGYLADLETRGETATGMAPRRAAIIDGTTVLPENNATAAFYTYTPHLEGNRNFWTVWNDWFKRAPHPSGTVLRDASNGALWLIQAGRRRAVSSMAVLASYMNPQAVIPVDTETLLSYDEGAALSYPNYSLVRDNVGDVYLIVNEEKRRFQTTADLPKFGYVPDEVMDADARALAAYRTGDTITYTTPYPQGAVVEDTLTKQRYYVDRGRRHLIVSDDLRESRFPGWRTRPIDHESLAAYPEGDAVTFPDGTLVKLASSPTVYLISEERRRPITDEGTFLGLGYAWTSIRTTSPEAIGVHQPGDLISYTPTQ